MTSRTLHLSAPMAFLAAPPGKSLPAQFAGIAYSGGLVPSYGAVIDVASTTVPKSMALLSEHQRDQIVGKVDDAGVRNGQIVVAGALFSDMSGTPAERIAQLAQRGTAFQLSVGLYNFSEESVPPGMTTSVNGQTFAGPLTVLRNGSVRECSVCVLGADPNTSVRMFGEQSNSRARDIRLLLAEIGAAPPQHEIAMLHTLTDTAFRQFCIRARELAARLKRLEPTDLYARRMVAATGRQQSTERKATLSATEIYRHRAGAFGAR